MYICMVQYNNSTYMSTSAVSLTFATWLMHMHFFFDTPHNQDTMPIEELNSGINNISDKMLTVVCSTLN